MRCNEFQNLIDAYLQETINEPRREKFEEHFFQCRKCFLGLKLNEALQNKDVRITLEEKPRVFVLKLFKPLLVMSSLFLLILFSVLLVQQKRQTRLLLEISAFEIPPYHQGELRSIPENGATIEAKFSRAMKYLQERQFRPALNQLEGPLMEEAAYPKIEFFRAICYLGEDEADKAGEIFDAIIRAMDPAYFDEALYYKGFVLLRQGQKQAARDQFEKLAGMLSPMSMKASAMVKKIEAID
ncbi:MAG: zf-HC2 domain-containing protein [Candidatus Aminicenantes bacterium]|nr:zf-HC2 domain-containing protein [Candidatus Aminicenantes bacterium]